MIVSGLALIIAPASASDSSTWGTFLTCRSRRPYGHWHVRNVPHVAEVAVKAQWTFLGSRLNDECSSLVVCAFAEAGSAAEKQHARRIKTKKCA